MPSPLLKKQSRWQQLMTDMAGKAGLVPVFILLLGLLVLAGHQSLGVIDRDEARFAQASKQMVQSGDFITPHFMDELRAKKPVGIYWLQSLSALTFGYKDIASYRLPSVIGLLLTLFITWHFSRQLWPSGPPHEALIAILLLAASPVILAEAHLATTDSLLLGLIVWQQLWLWQIYRDRASTSKSKHWLGFWLTMGFAILIKGPIAPLVALTTIIGLVLPGWHWRWLSKLQFIRGGLILLAINLPWALAVSLATGGAFLTIALEADFLSKVRSGQESHGAPFGSYFALFGLLFWPGLAFAGVLVGQGRALWKSDALRFCLAWFVGYWLVIELVPTKLPHYILPVLPALALMIAHALTNFSSQPTRRQLIIADIFYVLTLIWGVGLVVLAFWGAARLGGTTGGWAFLASCGVMGFFSVAIWQIWVWRQYRQMGSLLTVLLCGIGVHILLIAGVLASLSHIHIATRLSEQIDSLSFRPAVITLAGYHEPSAVFHLGRDILLLDGVEAAILMAEAPDGLAIIEDRQLLDFVEATAKLGLNLTATARLVGLNISKGREITLNFYQHKGP